MAQNSSIYIALGANLSVPHETFRSAIKALKARGVKAIKVSGLWQSPAWPPGCGHPDYINAAAEVEYDGEALALLELLHEIEAEFGRRRSVKNAPRTLDLDLLDFKGAHIDTRDIIIPHPRMMSRGFVLFPLSEIAPFWSHPVTRQTINSAIAELPLKDVAPMKWLGRLKNG